jgi:AcrR family transcriptional regulator
MPSTRSRLITAAFELFSANGYERTSVEDIAAQAGTGRTTFFRYFPSKDHVVFPDHDALLARVEARLATATADTRQVALREAARIVFDHYIAEGDIARARYQLTRSVPALRARELASVQRYVSLFRQHTAAWLADEPNGALRAELLASAVIVAHNHVLRAWLRADTGDPAGAFDEAMTHALATGAASSPTGRTVVFHVSELDPERVVAEIRRALERDGQSVNDQ